MEETDAREKNDNLLPEYSLRSAMFSIQFLMVEIELVVAED